MKKAGSKRKGTKGETEVVKLHANVPGFTARRQPLSGALIDFPHDVYCHHPAIGGFEAEVKFWKHGWRTGDNARGKASVLFIRPNFGDWSVYMAANFYLDLLKTIATQAEEIDRLKEEAAA